MDKIAHKLITKLIECILQSRIDIQKKQIRHFDEINKQIMSFKYKYKGKDGIDTMSLDQFLNSLLLHQKFAIASKISVKDHCSVVNLYFNLKNIKTGQLVLAQAWLVHFEQFRKVEEDHDAEQFQIIVTLFEELIIFLNRQPLFSEYQRNTKVKNHYSLYYQINIQNQEKCPSLKNMLSIMDLNHKHTKERVCKSFLIKIQCYYLDSLIDSLMGSTNLGNQNIEKKQELSTTQTKFKDSSPSQYQSSTKNRKVSVYEFYDQDLDFVFLSSDDQTFKKSPKSEIKEISFAGLMGLQDDDQFELLIISKDDEFLDDFKSTFIEISQNQDNYFTI